MKNSYVGIKKYRTHPLVKAALTMSWLLTVFAVAGAYLMYLYTDAVAAEYETARTAARYEAYLSASADVGDGDMDAAGDAISRYIIFLDGDISSAALLRDRLLSGDVSMALASELARILDAEREDFDEAITEAARYAEMMSDNAALRQGVTSGTASYGDDGWETLRERAEVRESSARRTAARLIGGGVTLTRAENHSFPLVYSYTCANASADVTRMGGKLLRMWVYRIGGAEMKSENVCRDAAADFVRDAGITDAVLYETADSDEDEISYIFCRRIECGGESVALANASVRLTVCRAGARVSFFDAGGYYRYKTRAVTLPEMKIDREKAVRMTGVSGEELMLIVDGGEAFWRVSGAENLLLDAKTGEIKGQNP